LENCPGNITKCCQRNHEAKNYLAIIGTGLSSTLLSSQRTTTHLRLATLVGDSPSGHSFNFTGSSWPCQPVSPGSCRSGPVRPRPLQRAAKLHALDSEDLAGRPSRLPPRSRPFPCRERTLPGARPPSKSGTSVPHNPRSALGFAQLGNPHGSGVPRVSSPSWQPHPSN